MATQTCPTCHGSGQIYVEGWVSCYSCGGAGFTAKRMASSSGVVTGGGGGSSYQLEGFLNDFLDAIPRPLFFILAAIGAIGLLVMTYDSQMETGTFVFMALAGGVAGWLTIPLAILAVDLAIKFTKLAIAFALAAGFLVGLFYAVQFLLG